jgi:hypothetical protein
MEYHGYWCFTAKRAHLLTITEDDYEYILNHSGAILVLYLMQRYFKSKFNKDKVPKEVFLLTLLKVVKLEGITSSWQGPKQSN